MMPNEPLPSIPSIFKRLEGPDRMSYIAAFRSPQGIVLSADTQETIGDDKEYVEKLSIHDAASFQVAIGGAGRGDLIEGFIQHLTNTITKKAPQTQVEFGELTQTAIREFYETDVRLCTGKSKTVAFLIAARHSQTGELSLWQTKASRSFAVSDYGVIGYDASLPKHLARRLYQPSLPLGQLVLFSVYLVSIAKSVALSVGFDTQVIVVNETDVVFELPEYVKHLEQRLASFTTALDGLLLSCPDLSLSVEDFTAKIDKFKTTALRLRNDYLESAVRTLYPSKDIKAPHNYERLPERTIFNIMGDGSLRWDEEADQEKWDWINEMCDKAAKEDAEREQKK